MAASSSGGSGKGCRPDAPWSFRSADAAAAAIGPREIKLEITRDELKSEMGFGFTREDF
jgi:hypothetical protein